MPVGELIFQAVDNVDVHWLWKLRRKIVSNRLYF
jgi:hypothetical protein